MSFVSPVRLLNHKVKEDFNINLLKINLVSHAKGENILQKLAFMNFDEISRWVEINSNAQKYIACPSATTVEDRNSCLNDIQDLLLRTIKGTNKRKDGRDLKLTKAMLNSDHYTIASILASAAWSYWRTYCLFTSGDAAFYANNHQKNRQKIELQKAQIEYIGAAVGFEKARKKGAFQEILDFEETEEILENNDFEV